ncbi:hypothetical protein Tco_1015841 [Tanacetum coccineum]|uniref:Uncharacterized protein n=1 Tax=Tanacetum coccineum TaxID=301880 RepID=A0ABQ5FLZ3_9ASTR
MGDVDDEFPMADRLTRKRTCLSEQAGRSSNVVVGEELNTSSTLVVPLHVTLLMIVYPFLDDDEAENKLIVSANQ